MKNCLFSGWSKASPNSVVTSTDASGNQLIRMKLRNSSYFLSWSRSRAMYLCIKERKMGKNPIQGNLLPQLGDYVAPQKSPVILLQRPKQSKGSAPVNFFILIANRQPSSKRLCHKETCSHNCFFRKAQDLTMQTHAHVTWPATTKRLCYSSCSQTIFEETLGASKFQQSAAEITSNQNSLQSTHKVKG